MTDTMVAAKSIRKGHVVSGPDGFVTVLKVSSNAVGRIVFDTDGKPHAAFSWTATGNILKRTSDVPVVTDAELAEVLSPVGELADIPQEVTSATETAEEAPKAAPRKRAPRKTAAKPQG
jgi:hypothetical protein